MNVKREGAVMYNLKRLGANIRYLRRAYGETQEELGYIINVEKNTISNYENGKREPDKFILTAIARHFMVTVEELIHQDFSSIQKLTFDNTLFFKKIDEIIPIISSNDAMENECFCKAYTAHYKIYEGLKKSNFDNIDKLDICIDGYFKAENDRNAKVESACNLISMFYLLLIMFKDTPSIISNPPAILIQIAKKDDNTRKIIENPDSNFENECKELLEMFEDEDFQEMLDEYKYILKKSQNWSELADYFLALQYVFNLVQNNLTPEFNRRVGTEMLNSLISVKNDYATRFMSLIREASGLKSSQTVG